MSLKDFFKPEHFNKTLIVLAAIVILVFVFSLGVFAGHEKARFSQRWGENYYRNIIGPRNQSGPGGFGMMDFDRRGFGARSGLGQIIKIDGQTVTINDQANVEKTILVTDQTIIVKDKQNIKVGDLKIDDNLVIIGAPNNQGQIEPKLIRVLPGQNPGMPAWQ
jgi:hypothetical protein